MQKGHTTETDHYRFLAGKHWLTDPIQGLFMSRPRKALIGQIKALNPQRVLDVCCGSGDIARHFTRAGIETTGVDSSDSMLQRAREKRRINHIHKLDVTQMDFHKEFDVAYVSLAIHEMSADTREQVWKKMLQAVRDGGTIIVLDFSVAKKKRFWSRFWSGFTELDEKSFLKTNPPHYYNYKEFMSNGGVYDWLLQCAGKIDKAETFFADTLAVLSIHVSGTE